MIEIYGARLGRLRLVRLYRDRIRTYRVVRRTYRMVRRGSGGRRRRRGARRLGDWILSCRRRRFHRPWILGGHDRRLGRSNDVPRGTNVSRAVTFRCLWALRRRRGIWQGGHRRLGFPVRVLTEERVQREVESAKMEGLELQFSRRRPRVRREAL